MIGFCSGTTASPSRSTTKTANLSESSNQELYSSSSPLPSALRTTTSLLQHISTKRPIRVVFSSTITRKMSLSMKKQSTRLRKSKSNSVLLPTNFLSCCRPTMILQANHTMESMGSTSTTTKLSKYLKSKLHLVLSTISHGIERDKVSWLLVVSCLPSLYFSLRRMKFYLNLESSTKIRSFGGI